MVTLIAIIFLIGIEFSMLNKDMNIVNNNVSDSKGEMLSEFVKGRSVDQHLVNTLIDDTISCHDKGGNFTAKFGDGRMYEWKCMLPKQESVKQEDQK